MGVSEHVRQNQSLSRFVSELSLNDFLARMRLPSCLQVVYAVLFENLTVHSSSCVELSILCFEADCILCSRGSNALPTVASVDELLAPVKKR